METVKDETPGVLKAAWLIAVVTIASKLMGFVRDMVVANFYGATMVSDAYFYALQIPSLAIIILGGVGGPFHSAVVAVFSKLLGDDYRVTEKINKLYNTFLTITFLFFAFLAVLGFFLADKLMGLIISAGSPDLVNLAAQHFRIMSPIILIGGIIGIFYGLLVSHKEFILPNLSPMMLSIVVIVSISLAHNDKSGIVLAGATLVGACCQLLLQFPKLRHIGYRIKPNFYLVNNPEFKNILELLFPAILSSTIGQIGIYVDMFFASNLQEGAWTSVVFANRIFQFPVGILVTAFLVPLFPIFSRLAGQNGEGKFDEIRNYFNKGVGVLFFVSIPIIIAILTLAKDGVSLVFERGAFNSDAVVMVTEALCFLSISILPYVFRDSITRVYYAFNDSKTPFVIAASSIVLKVFLNWLLILKFNMGIAGITLSTSCVTLFNAVLLGLFIHGRIRMNYLPLFINFGKMLLAGGITLAVCIIAGRYFDTITLPKYVFEGVKILSVGVLCITVYTALNLVFKMEYARELVKRFKM